MPAKQIDENIYLEDDYNEEVDEYNEEKSTPIVPPVKSRKKSVDEDEEEPEDAFYGLKDEEEE